MRVLLVEDNPGDVELFRHAAHGIDVPVDLAVASDGEEAWRLLQACRPEDRPDLVLLDLKLHRKSGLELLHDIKHDAVLGGIPVVVLTSSAADSDVVRAHQLGACAFFTKPIEHQSDVIEAILRFFQMATSPPSTQAPHADSDDDVSRARRASAEIAAAPGVDRLGSLQRLAAMAKEAPEPLVGFALDGSITSWNTAAERLFGYKEREMMGRDATQLVPETRRHELRSILMAIQRDEPIEYLDTMRLNRDGTKVPVALKAAPLHDARGNVIGGCVIARDLTERKQSEDRFRLAVEAAPSAMVMVNQAGIIVLVNAETEKLFGYGREELVGQPIELLVPERFRGLHPSHREAFLARPEQRAMGAGRELHAVRKDGTELPVEIGLNPVRTPDGLMVLSAIVDITERREAARALKQRSRELSRSNAELEQFAYIVSHDLQEPLRMVASYTQLLAKRYGDRLDERGHTFIRYAHEGAMRMGQLLRDLLAYSRVGTRENAPAAISARDVLQQALDNLRLRIDETRADIHIGELPCVLVDESQLAELFQNLIANALKFRKDERSRVEISAERDGSMWTFHVSDNGIGIAEQHADRIFEVFQRLHSREVYPGTGIGLAICKRIVERFGGEIWVRSTLGEGTCFSFTLPAVDADASLS